MNRNVMSEDEDKIAAAIEAGDTIYMEFTPECNGDNPVPTSIDMMAVTSQGVPIVNSNIPNTP